LKYDVVNIEQIVLRATILIHVSTLEKVRNHLYHYTRTFILL